MWCGHSHRESHVYLVPSIDPKVKRQLFSLGVNRIPGKDSDSFGQRTKQLSVSGSQGHPPGG